MWSVKCGVWSVKCGVQSVECGNCERMGFERGSTTYIPTGENRISLAHPQYQLKTPFEELVKHSDPSSTVAGLRVFDGERTVQCHRFLSKV